VFRLRRNALEVVDSVALQNEPVLLIAPKTPPPARFPPGRPEKLVELSVPALSEDQRVAPLDFNLPPADKLAFPFAEAFALLSKK
jgi:hypothetical protein